MLRNIREISKTIAFKKQCSSECELVNIDDMDKLFVFENEKACSQNEHIINSMNWDRNNRTISII